MEEINKIRQMLKDFTLFEPKPDDYSKFVNILTGNYSPPSYIVQILLLRIMDFKDYGRMDKVFWHTYLYYKNYPFMISDYKFGSWTIEGARNDEGMVRLAEEIRNKIIKASKVLDKALYSELKSQIEKENFYINNVYYKLSSFYDFYEEKVSDAVKEYEEFEEDKKRPGKISDIAEILNTKLAHERIISKYSFALILSFFSLLEFLLDVIYAFEQPNKKFFEYRKEKWNDRFKLVFSINKNKELKHLYDNLINIKTNYRNPLAHGLTNELNLLVTLPYAGLVPLSYEYLSNKTYYGFAEIEKDDALKIIGTFRKFLKFLENEEPYKCYMLYLNYGFPIPISSKKISEIKKEMTTYEDFEEYLDERAFYEDMVINRDV